MEPIIVQASWHNNRIASIPVTHVINAASDYKGSPNSRAVLMSRIWKSESRYRPPGILWLAPDVVLDLDDLAAMTDAIGQVPSDVHTGLVKLWPASTGRDDWMWSHRSGGPGRAVATQDEDAEIAFFSMDCLWTPARLLNIAFPFGEHWVWNTIDVQLSELAMKHGIPAHIVPGCRPKHLHFLRE